MSDIQIPNDWKHRLRTNIAKAISYDSLQDNQLYTDIGIAYQCYAPASLFKYYKDSERTLNSIKENRMWYSAPCNFNDVFDCDITFDRESMLNSLVETAFAHPIRADSTVGKAVRESLDSDIDALQETFSCMKSTIGIACMSERDNSLLMWAHYGNNHHGICVEYDLMRINQQLQFTPIPVIYSDSRTCFSSLNLTTLKQDTMQVFIENLTSKSLEWSYETEWRIIRENTACGNLWDTRKNGALLPMISPSSIILGCCASPEFSEEILTYCKANRIALYRMEKNTMQYRLNKKLILNPNNES